MNYTLNKILPSRLSMSLKLIESDADGQVDDFLLVTTIHLYHSRDKRRYFSKTKQKMLLYFGGWPLGFWP